MLPPYTLVKSESRFQELFSGSYEEQDGYLDYEAARRIAEELLDRGYMVTVFDANGFPIFDGGRLIR